MKNEEISEKRICNIYGFDGGNYAGNVYDKNYISPCIRTFGGGNQQPMIICYGNDKNTAGNEDRIH